MPNMEILSQYTQSLENPTSAWDLQQFLQALFIRRDSTPLMHFKTAAFYMIAVSEIIGCRLNVSLWSLQSALHPWWVEPS